MPQDVPMPRFGKTALELLDDKYTEPDSLWSKYGVQTAFGIFIGGAFPAVYNWSYRRPIFSGKYDFHFCCWNQTESFNETKMYWSMGFLHIRPSSVPHCHRSWCLWLSTLDELSRKLLCRTRCYHATLYSIASRWLSTTRYETFLNSICFRASITNFRLFSFSSTERKKYSEVLLPWIPIR